jgi:serine/threonine protein kinase/tetratricopeptide (TPR) repeat protein
VIAETISHYRIIKELGAGGIGEVYLAEDTRLGRQVALKFLPASFQYDSDRRTRFLAEARATSSLRSPHIAAIYDIGEHEGTMFLVMEYVEGEMLSSKLKRGPLAVREVIDVAAQIADALAEAHGLGLVHCDVKSSNLIVNERGFAKMLDFGLAKADELGIHEADDRTRKVGEQTAIGVVSGTLSYMSPEQALGRAFDHRSDVFSLGVVIYEMLSGRLPFEGDSSTEVIDKIIHSDPPAISRLNYAVPPELERITRKCLEKEPDRRYQSMREMLTDLRNLQRDEDSGGQTEAGLKRKTEAIGRSRARKAIDSLAVLPMENLSAEQETEYLSDGITESIINKLSKFPRLRVMARSTVFRYKGRVSIDPQEVGYELGVRAVLVGRMLHRGDSLVIKVELVDTNDGSHLWGASYNKRWSDIFSIEEEISHEISDALKLKLTSAQKKGLGRRYTENAGAYQLYLKGRYHWNKRDEDGIKKSIEYFEQAIALDANYALAYAGLADAYNLMASYSAKPLATPFLRAKATALKALSLDDSLAEAHAALAAVKLWREFDWGGGERGFRKAIDLNPGYSTAHLWLSLYLAAVENMDEALSEIRIAHELDPLSRVINLNLARVFYFARQYDESIDQCRKTIEMYPEYLIAHRRLGIAYGEKRMFEEAESEFKKALAISENDTETMSAMSYAYAASGRIEEARNILERVNELAKDVYVSPYSLARIHVGLGDIAGAFEALDKTYQERHGILTYLKVEAAFDRLRSDSRFAQLLLQMGLSRSA